VSLDRRSIEKRDFPTRLRGYDRAAVDAHLRALADELEQRLATTADATAEQVRAVLAAAQRSAAEIVGQAEADADRTRTVAGRVGDETAGRVTEAASGALERIETLRGELTALLDALRGDGADAVLVKAPLAVVPPAEPTRSAEPAVAERDAPIADDAGARLVALDLALGGAPREQADRYLAEHFRLGDRAALLDDVYAAAGR
jgi:DivIVA domain-containing protein